MAHYDTPANCHVSLMVNKGILSIVSFTAGMVFKVVEHMTEPGQAFLLLSNGMS